MRDAEIAKPRFVFGLKKRVVLLLVSLFLFATLGTTNDKPVITEENLKNIPTEKIAAQFREIRKIKGHFDGGEWNDDVDKWMGRKHQLMIELGVRLANNKSRKSDVLKLMGQPNQMVRKGEELFIRLTGQPMAGLSAAGSDELLVYYWRGTHDLLFFNSVSGRIVYSGWWYAGE